MAFHREWHAMQEGRGRQFWETVPDPSLDHLARVIAVLEAVRPISARPEFVADLRARLMADATANNTSTRRAAVAVAEMDCRLGDLGPFARLHLLKRSRATIDQPPQTPIWRI